MKSLRNELKERIRSNEISFDQIEELCSDGFWYLDLDQSNSKVWFGEKLCEKLGYNTSEILSVVASMMKEFDVDEIHKFIEMVKLQPANSKDQVSHVFKFKHKDGSSVWIRCKGFVVKNKNGKPDRILIAQTDVTNEREAQSELDFASKKYRELLFGLGDLVFVVDRSFVIKEYHENRNNEFLFTAPTLFLNKHLGDIGLSDNDLRQFITAISDSKIEPQSANLEFSLTVNGKKGFYLASVSAINNQDGQLLESIIIANNITEKRVAEVRLQELALVGSKTTDLTVVTDSSAHITWVNKAFEDHTGYKLEEIMGKNPSSFLHGPQSDPAVVERVNRAVLDRVPMQDTMINYTKSGKEYWVDFRIDPVFDEVGMCSHFISVERDVTLRKKAEEELAATRALLLETNRVGKVGGWSYNVATNTVYWTDVTREIHEVPTDYEPSVEKVIEFYKDGESREKYFEAGMNAIQHGIPYELELQIVTAKGKELWIKAIGKVEFQDGVCKRLFGTFQDIDSFKQVEKELKDACLLLENLTTHIPGCLYQYNLFNDGSFSLPYITEGIFSLTGYKPEQVTKNPALIFEVIHPDDVKRVQDAIEQSFMTLEKWECDYKIVAKNGIEKRLKGISRPEKIENGVTWYGFLQEINL